MGDGNDDRDSNGRGCRAMVMMKKLMNDGDVDGDGIDRAIVKGRASFASRFPTATANCE